jgi:hypothetical protein
MWDCTANHSSFSSFVQKFEFRGCIYVDICNSPATEVKNCSGHGACIVVAVAGKLKGTAHPDLRLPRIS